jgi:tetratricopeptide (TPR) repeat protein
VEAYPNSPRAWLNLGGVLAGRQENESAREAFMKVLELDSSMYAAHASLAASYVFGDPKDFAQAKAHAEHATTLLPEEAKGYELLGDTYRAMGELETAREAVQQANIELVGDPTFTRGQQANTLFWQAWLALKMGDFETAGAKADEEKALLEPFRNPLRFQGYHQLLGMIALEQGNDEEAVAHLSEANLNDVFVTYLMAVAQEGAGNTEEATRLFTQVASNNFNSVGYALVRRDAVKKAGMSP